VSSITIHNLEPDVRLLIEKQASEEGLSLNQLVKRLLRKALGLKGYTATSAHEFDEFAGLWAKEDAADFNATVEEPVLLKARKIAIKRNTTVNALVRGYLGQLVASHEQETSTFADELARAFARNTVKIGKRTWTRESLHERK